MKLRFALVTVLLLAPLSAPAAQSRRPQFSDSASLRASFLAVFGNDFELVKDELKPRPDDNGRDVFWLAYVKPRGPGHFVLRYRFKPESISLSLRGAVVVVRRPLGSTGGFAWATLSSCR
jgi:hypothetical protein